VWWQRACWQHIDPDATTATTTATATAKTGHISSSPIAITSAALAITSAALTFTSAALAITSAALAFTSAALAITFAALAITSAALAALDSTSALIPHAVLSIPAAACFIAAAIVTRRVADLSIAANVVSLLAPASKALLAAVVAATAVLLDSTIPSFARAGGEHLVFASSTNLRVRSHSRAGCCAWGLCKYCSPLSRLVLLCQEIETRKGQGRGRRVQPPSAPEGGQCFRYSGAHSVDRTFAADARTFAADAPTDSIHIRVGGGGDSFWQAFLLQPGHR